MKRTDMACDFLPPKEENDAYMRSFTVRVDEALGRKLHREVGLYATVECPAVPERRRSSYDEIAALLSRALRKLMPPRVSRVLVAGLGNPQMTADALGAAVCDALNADRCGEERICTLVPNVLGVTGVESFDVVAGVCARVHPDVVLAVDSLASAAVSRLASAYQVTDTGITPGSGVSNHRIRLCRDTLGVPVLSLGVPLVAYASTIIEDATGKPCPPETEDTVGKLLVTPKDVDVYVADCAHIFAKAISFSFSSLESALS